jgi:hypothetical protein
MLAAPSYACPLAACCHGREEGRRYGIYKKHGFCCFIGGFFVSACSRTVDFSRPYYPQAQETRPRVRLDEKLLALTEESRSALALEHGGNTKSAKLSERHLRLMKGVGFRSRMCPPISLPARAISCCFTAFEASYRSSLAISADGRTQIVDGLGKGTSNLESYNAAQDAIEKAVLDLKAKVGVLTRTQ